VAVASVPAPCAFPAAMLAHGLLLAVTWFGLPRAVLGATPSELMACPGGATLTTACMTAAKYDEIVAAVRNHLESLPSTCTASDCPQADWAGCVLRMAGHDFMDFANGQGGSDACTDMTDPDNAGLPACLNTGEHGISLREVYENFCTEVSMADFLVISAEAVIMSTRARHEAALPAAPKLDLKEHFRFGRTTAVECDFAAGRLPNPELGCEAVEQTFMTGMGLDWDGAAALMAVHTLGRAHIANSGYHGWWSDPENSRRFNNDYYVSLLAKGWIPELGVAGNSAKNQWERSDVGRDTSFDGHEMMLNTDLCLAFSVTGSDGVIATVDDCCAWLESNVIPAVVANNGGEYCGGQPGGGRAERPQCCGDPPPPPARRLQGPPGGPGGPGGGPGDCGSPRNPTGPAARAVLLYAANETAWLERFVSVWKTATENGHTSLKALGQCDASSTTQASSTTSTTTDAQSTTRDAVSTTTDAMSTTTNALITSTDTLSTTTEIMSTSADIMSTTRDTANSTSSTVQAAEGTLTEASATSTTVEAGDIGTTQSPTDASNTAVRGGVAFALQLSLLLTALHCMSSGRHQ